MTTSEKSFKEPADTALVNELRMMAILVADAEKELKDCVATRNTLAVQLVQDHGRSVSSVARLAQMTRAMLSERVGVAEAMERLQIPAATVTNSAPTDV